MDILLGLTKNLKMIYFMATHKLELGTMIVNLFLKVVKV